MEPKKHLFTLRDFQGFRFYYDKWRRKFVAKKDDIEIEASSEETLEIRVKNHLRESRKFKPLEVIHLSDGKVGRITSRVDAVQERQVYFSFSSEDGQKKHTKEVLMGYWSGDKDKSYFVEATPRNLTKLGLIKKEREVIKSCEKTIEELKAKMEKPVTWETLAKQAGED